jgi:hypothetical protein
MAETYVWRCWYGMICRCTYPSASMWKFYGGRGIKVDPRWSGEDGFVNFLADMGPPPTESHTIERQNVNGDYRPGNCVWLPSKRQARNTRATWRAPCGTPVADLADAAGLPMSTVSQRVHKMGWSLDKALSTTKKHNGVRPMPDRPHSRHAAAP